jgi:guanine deaminase
MGECDMTRSVIRNGLVLRGDLTSCRPADLLIEDGCIRAIEPPGALASLDASVIDAADRLLVPGLVNGHTHSHGSLAKGLLGDRTPLELLLNAGPALNGGRRLEDKRLSATLTAVELVRKGCTACYDLALEYPTPTREGIDAVAEAYGAVGMRAVVAPMMADRSLYDALPGLFQCLPADAQDRVAKARAAPHEVSLEAARDILRGWRHDRSRLRPAVAPTIPLHCSDEFLTACGRLSQEFDVRLQTHLAESKTQAVLGLKKYGRTLTAHLDALGLLNERFSAAHAVWLSREDIGRLAQAGAGVVHNPMSNLRLGSGVAPARAFLDAGVRFSIGTDATNCSDGQNMFEALRLATFLSRVGTPDYERWLSAEEVFSAATRGSAQILGFDDIGAIEPGLRADIVFLDIGHINYVPLREPLRQLVLAESGAAIASVMIDGKLVLREGRMLTIDEARLRREAEEAAARLDSANSENRKLADALADIVGHFCIAHARMPYEVHRRLPDEQY